LPEFWIIYPERPAAPHMVKNFQILASALRTVSASSADFCNDDPLSIGAARFYINITAVAGTTPSVTVTIEEYDPTSNTYNPVLVSAALTAAGKTVLTIAPGTTAAANVTANTILSRNFRVSYAIGGSASPSVTFSIGASIS
jgi:hypothetical protein